MQKKLLSLFLSALILLSCFSVGFIAFAQETQAEDAETAVETVVDAEEVDETAEMLEEYLELSEQEDEMTKAQREKKGKADACRCNRYRSDGAQRRSCRRI